MASTDEVFGTRNVDKAKVIAGLRFRQLHARADWVDRELPGLIDTYKNSALLQMLGIDLDAMAPGGRGPMTVALTVGGDRRLSLAQGTRMTALVSMALADTTLGTVRTKYTYRHWRPTTAIREADTDGNPLTHSSFMESIVLAPSNLAAKGRESSSTAERSSGWIWRLGQEESGGRSGTGLAAGVGTVLAVRGVGGDPAPARVSAATTSRVAAGLAVVPPR